MAELVYTRVSTDEQSTQRQTHLLAEAGLITGAQGVRLFADPATSSKIPALERPGFRELARYARPGDRLTVSELYRLCRDLADILAVRDWCRAHDVKLRVLSGAVSSIVDLAAADATTTMLVNVLVSVGQFQRDLQNELTRDGLAAAWAGGAKSGRRPRLAQLGVLDQVRRAFRNGASIAALARDHQVSRVAIRSRRPAIQPTPPARSHHRGRTSGRTRGDPRQDRRPPQRSPRTRRGRAARAAAGPHGTPRPGLQPARHRTARRVPGTARRRSRAGRRRGTLAARKAYRIYSDRLNNAVASTLPV
ncbi:recombinase family protein [Dactylosporangium cerinum]